MPYVLMIASFTLSKASILPSPKDHKEENKNRVKEHNQ